MCSEGGAAATEELLLRGQKSTNQLRALLASLPPADGAPTGCSGAVEALLSDISDSLSQALAFLQLGAPYNNQRDIPAPRSQGFLTGGSCRCGGAGAGAGGRRSTSRRSAQRMRADGECRAVTQHEDSDPYKWRKYGQKDILGAKFARSYFKCAHKSDHGCCSARKQVQQSDADPSVLEIIYIGAHTCLQPAASHSVPEPISSGTRRSGETPGDHRATDVTTEMSSMPWMELEPASLFLVPSPACSLSELLSAEVPQLIEPACDLPVLMELKMSDGHVVVSDSVVPEL